MYYWLELTLVDGKVSKKPRKSKKLPTGRKSCSNKFLVNLTLANQITLEEANETAFEDTTHLQAFWDVASKKLVLAKEKKTEEIGSDSTKVSSDKKPAAQKEKPSKELRDEHGDELVFMMIFKKEDSFSYGTVDLMVHGEDFLANEFHLTEAKKGSLTEEELLTLVFLSEQDLKILFKAYQKGLNA